MSETELVMGALPKRIIHVKPVVWEGWLHKGHSGVWLNDGAIMAITVPVSRSTGELINPLTKEEQEFFEDRSRCGMDFAPGDLSPYKKPDPKDGKIPYWHWKEVIIRKPDTIVDNDTVVLTLDLSIPEKFLEYKILLANSGPGGIVAKNWESRFDSGDHKLVIVEEGYDVETKVSTAADNIAAYKLFDKIQTSQTKLYEFLSVYWLENPTASAKPSIDAKIPFMVAQVEDIIKANAKKFVSIMTSDYQDKLMIHDAIRLGVLKLIGNTFVLMPDEIPVGSSLKEVILYLKDERHQEDRLKLIAQITAESKK